MNQSIILTTQDELYNIVKTAIADALHAGKQQDEPKPHDKPKTLLNSRELAKTLKCSYQTIWNHTNAGKIPFIKNNRAYLYDLDLVLESMTKKQSV